MKMELGPVRPSYVTPDFSADDRGAGLDPALKQRMRRPILLGSAVVGVFVLGVTLWAAVSPIASAVVAPAVVRVEANRQIVRHREGGTVRQILVHEGQKVRQGQTLLLMNDVQPLAAVEVLQNQYDTLLAQSARFQAEATGRSTLSFPPELTSRATDPRVAGVIRDQEFLFSSRLQTFQTQNAVLAQRADQIDTQISGVKAQLDSVAEQVRLTQDELNGYQTLYEKGFAPRTLILRYQRSLADLAGRRGALTAEINRLGEARGEARLQLSNLRQERISQAAEGLRQMQTGLSDATPKLAAARQALANATVKSPADGYVLGLTQHTVGGVVGPGELLMNVVPTNTPLIVTGRIKPQDIDDVRPGMDAKVRLSAFNYRKVSPVEGKVMTVSADQLTEERSGEGYFQVDVRIPPAELAKLPKGASVTPGMPAQVMIQTGKRTILSYVVSPLTDTIRDALKEE